MRKSRIATLSMVFVTIVLLVLAPAGVGCTFTHDYDYCDDKQEIKLLAGQTIEAGTITVSNYGMTLNIVIETTGGWIITESHVDVGDELIDIPQTKADKKGNTSPKIGKFTFSTPDEQGSNYHWYQIDLTDSELELDIECGDELYIAVHAVVKKRCGDSWSEQTAWGEGTEFGKSWAMYFIYELECCKIPTFPSTGKAYNSLTGPGYWRMTFSDVPSGYNLENGPYVGWCIQSNVYINNGKTYTYTLYSSLNPPSQFADDDWDLINYIINQRMEGEYPSSFSTDEIQRAIWYFLEQDEPHHPGTTLDLNDDSWWIINDAKANGEGYHPGANSDDTVNPVVAVILYLNSNTQGIIIELDP